MGGGGGGWRRIVKSGAMFLCGLFTHAPIIHLITYFSNFKVSLSSV